MMDKNASISDIIIGEQPKAYVLTVLRSHHFPSVIGIAAPVLASLDEYRQEYAGGCPLHVFLAKEELSVFEDGMAQIGNTIAIKESLKTYRLYGRVLREQGIDITREISIASRLSSDQEEIEHLRQLNLVLRRHMIIVHRHYAVPVRLPRQKGILRKPKTIQPVNIIWP